MIHVARSAGRLVGGVLAVASLGCGADRPAGPPDPVPPAVGELRLRYSGGAVGSLHVRGEPGAAHPLAPPFVALTLGKSDGVNTPNAVLARVVPAPGASTYHQLSLHLHPGVTRAGHYPAGACPEPAALGGCFSLLLQLDVADDGGPAAWVRSTGGDVTLVVEELTPMRIRARFSGQFTYFRRDRPGGVPVTVTDGYVEAARM